MQHVETRMLLVEEEGGRVFTVTEHVRCTIAGDLEFETETVWVVNGRELTDPEIAGLKILREISDV